MLQTMKIDFVKGSHFLITWKTFSNFRFCQLWKETQKVKSLKTFGMIKLEIKSFIFLLKVNKIEKIGSDNLYQIEIMNEWKQICNLFKVDAFGCFPNFFFLHKICRLNFWTVKLAEFIYKKCIFFSICVRFFHIIIIAIWIICYFCNHTHTSLIISAKRFSTYCSFFAFLIVRNTMVFNLKCNINQKLNVSSVVLQFVLL